MISARKGNSYRGRIQPETFTQLDPAFSGEKDGKITFDTEAVGNE